MRLFLFVVYGSYDGVGISAGLFLYKFVECLFAINSVLLAPFSLTSCMRSMSIAFLAQIRYFTA